MRRFRRWALLLGVVVGSIAGLGQWLLRAEAAEDHAAAGAAEQVDRPARTEEKEAVDGPFGSRAACEQALQDRRERRMRAVSQDQGGAMNGAAKPAPRGPRIGTWNVRWFPRGTADGKDPSQRTDVAWLACTIAWLEVDVLAVQEILGDLEGRRAALELTAKLDELTGGRYRLELDDCSDGRQHVGLLWDEERVQLRDLRSIAALNPTGEMCGSSLRPGFGAHARFADGTDLHVISVHLDSGEQARDFGHRGRSAAALARVVEGLATSDREVLVLGDFNAMGCEGCEPKISAEAELSRLESALQASGLARLAHERADNRCSHYYRGRAGLLDLAAASTSLAPRVSEARAEGVCAALACERPKRGESVAAWRSLSDHCPIVVQLKPRALQRQRARTKGR